MLLRIENLRIELDTPGGPAAAVDDVTLELERGATLALVGESGCGKTLTALAVLRLLPPAARVAAGRVFFDGRDLLTLPERELRRVRGGRIAMIFQEPMTALNPLMPVGRQVEEPLRIHRRMSAAQRRRRVVELLRRVGIPSPERRAASYPHQLSGGQRQRVLMAMALACEPALLIADEPTTALDTVTQAQIVELLRELQRQSGLAVLFITHDLGLVSGVAQRVCVMYAGRIIEAAPCAALLTAARHPYTQGLLRSVPRPALRLRRLPVIPGEAPPPALRPSGCAFHPRCERGRDDVLCRTRTPALEAHGDGRWCACWHAPPGGAPDGLRCTTSGVLL